MTIRLPQPVTWTTWWLWVLAGALTPVSYTFVWMALNKRILPTDPFARPIWWATTVVLIGGLIAPTLLQWLVLRRVVPRLNVLLWVLAAGLPFLVLAGAPFLVGNSGFNWLTAFVPVRGGSPWWKLIPATLPFIAIAALPPAFLISFLTGARVGRGFILWGGLIAGLCTAEVVENAYRLFNIQSFDMMAHLNGRPWSQRVSFLMIRAFCGATGAAVSGIALAFALRQREDPGQQLNLARPLGIAMACLIAIGLASTGPVYSYLSGPRGILKGIPEIRKALSFAPSSDRSEGMAILVFSHEAEIATYKHIFAQYAEVSFAPDGKSLLAIADNGRLTQIELSTGRALRQIGAPRDENESPQYLWTPDGKYFLLRESAGKRTIKAGTREQTIRQKRITVYSLPEYEVAGQFEPAVETCGIGKTMAVEPDGNFWLTCGQYRTPQPEDLLAIKLAVPSLEVLKQRRHGEAAVYGKPRNLLKSGETIWLWQEGKKGARGIRFEELTGSNRVTLLNNEEIYAPDRAGSLTFQSLWTEIAGSRVTLPFCGEAERVSNPPTETTNAPWGPSFCRYLTYDLGTGTLVKQKDGPETRMPRLRNGNQFESLHDGSGLAIEGEWSQSSETGALLVRDTKSGAVLQTVKTAAQNPVAVSRDGKWLITHAFDERRLRIYRIDRQ